MAGLADMSDLFLSEDPHKNLPFTLATIQYLLVRKNKSIHVLMPYAQKLIRLADWYRQLLAESIGKAVDNNGKAVNIGITPVNALGATDQHSQSQLYNEGPNDKLIMFISVRHTGREIRIPNLFPRDPSVGFIKNLSFNTLMRLEQLGTADAYTKNNRPNLTIEIDKIDAYTLGQLFMLFEGSVAFLGEYFNVNAFDQPGVELSKNLTREYALALQKTKK
jgi:glucose-6-phosphate isomerase